MPKSTFFNLSTNKRQWVEDILLNVFYDRHISQVRVSEIVDQMQMARGSFYKYFEDLEDAHLYLIRRSSGEIHQDILQEIYRGGDFFQGVENYLKKAAETDHGGTCWKKLQLLTKSSDIFAKRREDITPEAPMFIGWQKVLQDSQIQLASFEEELAFLYFAMELVMDSLTAFVVNKWDEATLIKEYRYKVGWLRNGL